MAEIYHFMTYRIAHTRERHCPTPWKMRRRQRLVERLHNLRLAYDRIGFAGTLKRVESKRRYYKRVRQNAPYASKIPKEINGYVDSLRSCSRVCAKVYQLPTNHGKNRRSL